MAEHDIYVALSDPPLNAKICPESGRDATLIMTVCKREKGPEDTDLAKFYFERAPASCPPRTKWLRARELKLTKNDEHKARNRSSGVPTIASVENMELLQSPCELSLPYMFALVAEKLPGNWREFHQQILRFVEVPSVKSPVSLDVLCQELGDSWLLLASDGKELRKSSEDVVLESKAAMVLLPVGLGVLGLLPSVRKAPRNKPRKTNRAAFTDCREGSLGDLYRRLVEFDKFDPRREKTNVYSAASLLTLICLARHAGAASHQSVAKFAKESLSRRQREEIGLGKKVETGPSTGNEKIPTKYVINDFISDVVSDFRSGLKPDLHASLFGDSRPDMAEDLLVMDESEILAIFEDWLTSHKMKAFTEGLSLWSASRAEKSVP